MADNIPVLLAAHNLADYGRLLDSMDSRRLPPDARHRIRRTQRAYADRWVAALTAVAPALPDAVARARVQAAFGLVNAVADMSTPLDDAALGAQLGAMARAALLAPAPGDHPRG